MAALSADRCRSALFTLITGSLISAPLAAPLAAPLPGRSEVLYTLTTRCSLDGGKAQPCQVEATNSKTTTLYRHTIGAVTETIQISDQPVRMAIWNAKGKRWQSLTSAEARFSTNTVCFNGRALCVVNPNYLNSVRQDRPETMAGRDLVEVFFGSDGRINLSCYDDGCKRVAP